MLSSPRQQIAAAFGLAGSICALALVIFGNTTDLRYVWGNEIVIIVLAAPSAWLAGLIVAELMGEQGGGGWFRGLTGYVIATVLGAAIAGTALMPGFGTVLAPWILLAHFVVFPIVGAAWLLIFVGVQKMAVFIKA